MFAIYYLSQIRDSHWCCENYAWKVYKLDRASFNAERMQRVCETSAAWCVQFQSLPSSYHVISVDLPGHGDSSIPAATDDVSMSLILDALREV